MRKDYRLVMDNCAYPSTCCWRDLIVMTSGLYEKAPAIPVHTSRDGLTWTEAIHIVPHFEREWEAVWVATLRFSHLTNRLHCMAVIRSKREYPSHDLCFFEAENPEGPWTGPILTGDFDEHGSPELFIDTDGSAYVIRRQYLDDKRWAYCRCPVDLTRHTLEESEPILFAADLPAEMHHSLGGFHQGRLFKHDSMYYLCLGARRNRWDFFVHLLRSPLLTGPWEALPGKFVDSGHYDDGKLYAIHNAEVLDTRSGQYSLLLVATFPWQQCPPPTPIRHQLLAGPLVWQDGWPLPSDSSKLDDMFRDRQ